MNSFTSLASVLTAAVLAAGSPAAFADKGTITHLVGALSSKKADGSLRLLAERSEVATGDTLVTERDTFANIRFADGGQLTLKPSSSVTIESLQYEPSKPKEDSFILRLVSGGLRLVTGEVGSRSRHKFVLRTATVTIGIRGTAFSVDDCLTSSEGCGKLDPGVYVSVSDGAVELSGEAVRLILQAGQFGRTGKDLRPRRTLNPGLGFTPPPSFLQPSATGPRPVECVLRR
jgi:ferric-dicitrate binding protein FerR (iron transport regulator)